jgi:hypothetical protein
VSRESKVNPRILCVCLRVSMIVSSFPAYVHAYCFFWREFISFFVFLIEIVGFSSNDCDFLNKIKIKTSKLYIERIFVYSFFSIGGTL